MEFKKFEDKLIIENLMAYCIENNISSRELNAFTVKIKNGKLDEAFREKLGELFRTEAGKYRTMVKSLTTDFNKAKEHMDNFLNKLNPSSNVYVFKNITLPEKEKNDLLAAVQSFKTVSDTAFAQTGPALQALIGKGKIFQGEQGEEAAVNIDIAFPKLKNGKEFDTITQNAYPENKSDFVQLKSKIIKNIQTTYKQNDPSKHPQIYNLINNQLNNALELLNNVDTKTQGYNQLLVLAGGRSDVVASTTPAPIDERTILNYFNQLISNGYSDINQDLVQYLITLAKNSTPKKEFLNLLNNLFAKNIKQRDISNAFEQIADKIPDLKNTTNLMVPSTTGGTPRPDVNKIKNAINQVIFKLQQEFED